MKQGYNREILKIDPVVKKIAPIQQSNIRNFSKNNKSNKIIRIGENNRNLDRNPLTGNLRIPIKSQQDNHD